MYGGILWRSHNQPITQGFVKIMQWGPLLVVTRLSLDLNSSGSKALMYLHNCFPQEAAYLSGSKHTLWRNTRYEKRFNIICFSTNNKYSFLELLPCIRYSSKVYTFEDNYPIRQAIQYNYVQRRKRRHTEVVQLIQGPRARK